MSTQYQLLPALTDDEYETLKADIADRGVMVPIEYDDQGNVLDGHHRLRICQELGITNYPAMTRLAMTEEQKITHVLALNLARRHLSKEQRIELEANLRAQGWSYPRIAEVVKVSDETVRRDLIGSTNVEPDLVTGKDGKRQAAKKKPKPKPQATIFTRNAKEQERAQDAAENIATAPASTMDLKRAERVAREQTQEAERELPLPPMETDTGYDLRHGDFRHVLSDIQAGTVDMVFTDPPYGQDYLWLWETLSRLAARILKRGGLLITYTGQHHLPMVMRSLESHLEYVWMGSILTHGAKYIDRERHIYAKCKPLLFYSHRSYIPFDYVDDFIADDKPEKDAHDWQQGIAPALYYIEHLTPPGGLVVDPFLGSGTTAVAARMLGRSVVGCDIDLAAIKTSMERLNAEL